MTSNTRTQDSNVSTWFKTILLVLAFFVGSGAITLTAGAETMLGEGGTMAGY